MKNKRKEPKLAAEIDRAALKRKASEEKVSKKKQRSRGGSQGVRPIGDDFQSLKMKKRKANWRESVEDQPKLP